MTPTLRIKYISLLLLVFVIVIAGFRQEETDPRYEAARVLTESYKEGVSELFELSEQLILKAEKLDASQPSSLEELQSTLIQSRNAFKKIEFMVSFLESEFVKDWVNGPPLLHIERNMPSMVTVREPKGLQILDELIFSEDEVVFEEKETILFKTKELRGRLNHLNTFTKGRRPIADRYVFEAAREELVRIFTLGLTGFDTPLSGNAMQEARIAYQSISSALSLYEPELAEKDGELARNLIHTLEKGNTYLSTHQDFDSFDRIAFFKNYIDPVYGMIHEAHKALGLSFSMEYSSAPPSLNPKSSDIFSDDFINKGYYISYASRTANEKVVGLGKMLFFDPALSINNERSCASCHQPEKAFTDGKRKSLGLNFNGTVDRNSPSLINSVYADRYFHDLKSEYLEDQIEHVIVSRKEFHTTYLDLFAKLGESEEYRQLFTEAFPDKANNPIDRHTLTTSITAYVASLTGLNSPFDQYMRSETSEIDSSAYRGFNLFMGKAVCGTCHFAPVFNGTVPPRFVETESEVLGILANKDHDNPVLDDDPGRARNGRANERSDIYMRSFKTPTVRNIALTAPYMHNGVYDHLEDVMDFYNKGGGGGMGLDLPNQTLPFDSLGLNPQEITDVISFMEMLTDTTGMTSIPSRLPAFPEGSDLNKRKVGGLY